VRTTFTLSGTVTGSDTKQPLAGAELEARDGSIVGKVFPTDASGAYAIPSLGPGTYTFYIRKAGYSTGGGQATIANTDARLDVVLDRTPAPAPPSAPSSLTAAFNVFPNPCTMSGTPVTVNCAVDGNASAGPSPITAYAFTYLGLTATSVVSDLRLTCGDGPEQEVHIPVTLTVTDADGNQNSTTKFVTVVKIGACGF